MPDEPIELDTIRNERQPITDSPPTEPTSTESVQVEIEEPSVYAEPPLSYEESMRATPVMSSPILPPPSLQTQEQAASTPHDDELPPVYSNEEEPPTYEQVIRRTLKRKECWMSSFIMLAIAVTFILQFGIQLFRAPKLTYREGVGVTEMSKSNQEGYRDGPMEQAMFRLPADIVVAKDGSVYISDSGNHVIRQWHRNNTVTTLAGTAGVPGIKDGNRSEALFRKPWGLAVDPYDNLIVADSHSCSIRNVTKNGNVTTLYSIEPCSPANELLSVAVTSNGTIFLSTQGRTMERLTPNGNGFTPSDWRIDSFFGAVNKMALVGNLLYTARQSGHIRVINLDTGAEELKNGFANGGAFSNPYSDGDVGTSLLCNPFGIAFSPKNSSEFFASSTCSNLLKVLTPKEVLTVAGTLERGYRHGRGFEAAFSVPVGMAVVDEGLLLVADHYNHQIRYVVYL
jgi:sugar lactone lactonase YvrE